LEEHRQIITAEVNPERKTATASKISRNYFYFRRKLAGAAVFAGFRHISPV
jgi:hypothetical protein